MKFTGRVVLLGVLVVGTPCDLIAGDIYKWVDEKGVTHYSDKPLPQGKKVPLPAEAPSKPSGGDASKLPKTSQELEREFQERQLLREREERREQAAREAAARAEKERQLACSKAYARIDFLAGRKTIWRYTEKGTKEFVTDEERSAEIDKLKQFVDQNCRS